ncbi:hypothetical protein PENSPDRAFT_634477 [Peniophora sp. CONT]|nr:hypothetical protein PENSPDRAFT_634477 [Peniophora sp. CONT]
MRRAVECAPELDLKLTRLNFLGRFLRARFERLSRSEDLESALSVTARAVQLTSDGHPDQPMWLNNIAAVLRARYEHHGQIIDLEKGISSYYEAMKLMPEEGHPQMPTLLIKLGGLLTSRYERLGELHDIETTMTVLNRAREIIPDDHPDVPTLLYNTGITLYSCYQRSGDINDLESAVVTQKGALALYTDNSPNKLMTLDSLVRILLYKHQLFGELETLNDAICMSLAAIKLSAELNLEDLSRLIRHRSAFHRRFQCLGNLTDLEVSISIYHRVAILMSDDHPDKPSLMRTLGDDLYSHYELTRDLDDLEGTIAAQSRAVELSLDSHPDKPTMLDSLVNALLMRYDDSGMSDDLERAISLASRALDTLPDNDEKKPAFLSILGSLLHLRHQRLGNPEDIQNAISMQHRAVDLTTGSDKALAVSNLSDSLWTNNPETHILVFTRVLDFLPERVWLGYNVIQRYKESAKLHDLIKTAVATVIECGKLELAVEWLEEGRALVWSQILSLRAPFDDLSQQQPDLAYRFREVLDQLRDSAHRSLLPDVATGTLKDPGQIVTNTAADHHRQLAITHESLLSDIRACAGFEDFMRPKKFAALIPPPHTSSGPVVFINVAVSMIYDQACSALILFPGGLINSVALPELSPERADRLRSLWTTCIQRKVRERHTARVGLRGSSELGSLLEHLWTWIVEPILRELKFTANSVDGNALPHITWCPTGPLTQLPLHAAGLYEEECGPRVFNFVVSSYIPSLSALLRCQQLPNAQVSASGPVLVVTQPHTPGLPALPGTLTEGIRLHKRMSELQIPCTILNDDQATTEYVGAILSQHPWIHLACHGSQHLGDPTQSAFALFDGPLSLSDLMGTVADNAELAFLSACQTAVGDYQFPEESAHLAAGMLAVGFKGVVATMWSIGDKDAPIVVEEYYERLLELRRTGAIKKGSTGAAYALHEAVRCLRNEVGVENFEQWAPFAHFGV